VKPMLALQAVHELAAAPDTSPVGHSMQLPA
jgi:hypothetical protein